MRQKIDIHHYERRIQRVLEKINESSISQRNKDLIKNFYRERLSIGLSKGRQYKYLYSLDVLARALNQDFESATKDNLIDLVGHFENSAFTEWTKHDYKVVLKIFYRWLRRTDEYPPEVKWIKTTVHGSHLLPDEILTEEEVNRMVDCSNNLRDKALVLMLYESGCRISELLTVNIRNVQFDDYGAVLLVTGKTGDRRVRIIASAPKLASWLENHPLRRDVDAPLWVSLSQNNRHDRLSYRASKCILQELAKQAGIRKRIYPHLFRHSRATFLARYLTESQLKHHFGWVQSSNMASTYVHLSGRDVDSALFNIAGIEVKKNENESLMRTVPCFRCQQKNSPTSKFCMRCGSPLDMQTALKIDETRVKIDSLMNSLIEHPAVLSLIMEKIDEMKSKH